jgi:hypothetical protein
LIGTKEFERGAHFPIWTAPGKFGGKRPLIDLVFAAERESAEAVLLAMVNPAEADPEHVVGLLRGAGISGGSQMGELDLCRRTSRDAAAM